MNYPVDLSLFQRKAHNPSYRRLQASMGPSNKKLIDFCIPVNSYFPTPEMLQVYAENLHDILKYYPSQNMQLSEIVADVFGYNPENLLLFNGSTELATYIDLFMVNESFCTPTPTWGRWTDLPKETGKQLYLYQRKEENNYHLDPDDFADYVLENGVQVAVVCNPNNPTGALLSMDELRRILDRLASIKLVIIDEAFIDFSFEDPADIPTCAHEAIQRDNVIVVKSLGKNLGLHGIRLGYGIASKKLIQQLNVVTPKWNINGMAESLIRDLPKYIAEYEAARQQQVRDRFYLEEELRKIPELTIFESRANFIYVKLPDAVDGFEFRNRMISLHGCYIRECGNKLGSSSQYLRVAVRPREHVDHLLQAIKLELAAMKSPVRHKGSQG